MIERIAILGGSSVYIPEFILSVVSHNINVKEIVLQGRPGAKLPLVAQFCQRLIDKSGFPARVIAATDVREAVSGANYIINHVRVGGMQARLRDEKLPPRLGLIGDESLGAGGFSNALRTLPVVLEYVKCIEEVNPGATLINLSNPMGLVMEAIFKTSKLRAVGVCDLPVNYIKRVAEILRCDVDDLEVDYIGLYHMGWIQDVKIDGRSQMSRVLDRLEAQNEDGFDSELIELFRMIPTGTVSLYFHQDAILKKQQSCDRFRAEILHEAERQILRLYEDSSLSEVPDLTRARNAIWYEESIVPLIKSLESKEDCSTVLCVRNEGCIRELTADSSVELPAKISKKGIRPRKVGSCPRFLKGLFLAVKESDRLAVEAIRHRSYEYALQSLTVNPLVPSYDAAKRYLDRVMRDEQVELH